jgi:hypothetical protein
LAGVPEYDLSDAGQEHFPTPFADKKQRGQLPLTPLSLLHALRIQSGFTDCVSAKQCYFIIMIF